jgi:hypothetical protein
MSAGSGCAGTRGIYKTNSSAIPADFLQNELFPTSGDMSEGSGCANARDLQNELP